MSEMRNPAQGEALSRARDKWKNSGRHELLTPVKTHEVGITMMLDSRRHSSDGASCAVFCFRQCGLEMAKVALQNASILAYVEG